MLRTIAMLHLVFACMGEKAEPCPGGVCPNHPNSSQMLQMQSKIDKARHSKQDPEATPAPTAPTPAPPTWNFIGDEPIYTNASGCFTGVYGTPAQDAECKWTEQIKREKCPTDLDIYFVVDLSGSVGLTGWGQEVDFMRNVITKFNQKMTPPATATGSRVGILFFSEQNAWVSPDDAADDPAHVPGLMTAQEAWAKVNGTEFGAVKGNTDTFANNWWAVGKYTWTRSALLEVEKEIARKGSKPGKTVVIVITDGVPDAKTSDYCSNQANPDPLNNIQVSTSTTPGCQDPIDVAERMRKTGAATIYGVGIATGRFIGEGGKAIMYKWLDPEQIPTDDKKLHPQYKDTECSEEEKLDAVNGGVECNGFNKLDDEFADAVSTITCFVPCHKNTEAPCGDNAGWQVDFYNSLNGVMGRGKNDAFAWRGNTTCHKGTYHCTQEFDCVNKTDVAPHYNFGVCVPLNNLLLGVTEETTLVDVILEGSSFNPLKMR